MAKKSSEHTRYMVGRGKVQVVCPLHATRGLLWVRGIFGLANAQGRSGGTRGIGVKKILPRSMETGIDT